MSENQSNAEPKNQENAEVLSAGNICYVALWEDRHTDVEPYVFLNKKNAIEWAKQNVRKSCRQYPEDLGEGLNDSMRSSGWVYYGRYSCEGDHISVRTCEINSAK